MNKWSKLALFVTLISTFIALGTGLYLTVKKDADFPKEQFNNLVTTQKAQGDELASFKTEVNEKIDLQNKTIIEYNKSITEFDERITSVEETQAEFLTIVVDKEKEKAQTPPATTPTIPTVPTVPTTTPEVKPEVKPETPKRPETVFVSTRDGLHLRSGASESSSTMGVMPYGTKLTVIGGPETTGKHDWYQVRTGTGREGWVAIQFVE